MQFDITEAIAQRAALFKAQSVWKALLSDDKTEHPNPQNRRDEPSATTAGRWRALVYRFATINRLRFEANSGWKIQSSKASIAMGCLEFE